VKDNDFVSNQNIEIKSSKYFSACMGLKNMKELVLVLRYQKELLKGMVELFG